MCRAARSWLVVLLAVLAGAMWCARSSEAQKSRHLERSERYFARAQDRGAIIDYRNVLSVDAANVQGVRQGEVHTALTHLRKAVELEALAMFAGEERFTGWSHE